MGFQAFQWRKGTLTKTLGIEAAREPQTIALRVPDFRGTTSIIITNESYIGAQVEVLDAAVLVDAEDWPQVKARMADQPSGSGKAP